MLAIYHEIVVPRVGCIACRKVSSKFSCIIQIRNKCSNIRIVGTINEIKGRNRNEKQHNNILNFKCFLCTYSKWIYSKIMYFDKVKNHIHKTRTNNKNHVYPFILLNLRYYKSRYFLFVFLDISGQITLMCRKRIKNKSTSFRS